MALDPTKKKDPLNPTANLPAGVQAGMAALPPGYAAGQSLRTGIGQALNRGLTTAAGLTAQVAAPAVLAPALGANVARGALGAAPAPAPVPVAPVQKPVQPAPAIAPAGAPARNPAVPASSAGATAPGGGVPAPRPVAYNAGSGATYTTGDGRLGNLPAGIAVTKQKNGVNAFGGTGASVAAATGSPLGAAPAPFAPPVVAQPNLAVPSLDLPSINTLRTSDAERERAGLAKNIDDQLRDMNFAGLNSRGKRELYANLLRERSGLAENGGNLAGTAAQAQLDAATRAGTATQSQVGENARAQLGELGANQRATLGTAADLFRANLDASKVGQMDASGNLLTTLGTPITGADGKPVRGAQTKADGAITPAVQLDSLTKRYTALLGQPPIDPAQAPQYEAQKAALAQQIEALSSAGAGGQGQAASGVPAGYTLVGTKDGKRIFKDANGKTYSE